MKKFLNIGSGKDYKKSSESVDWVNLDFNSDYKVDVKHNLDKFPYPFKKEEFDLVYCSHILEHVEDLMKTLKELVRVTKKGGIIHIRVPHFSNGIGYNDPTHKRFFGWFTFEHLINGYMGEKLNLKIVKRRYNFLSVEHAIANTTCSWFYNIIPKMMYERFLCWIFPVGEIELKLKVI
ncbi:MAG: class I SAM-dependent methyltransferase [Nanoarchaeota archaeon]|nr:class I SAM-dependent methyltransferase [Nanoarchaeota archaeon]